MVSPSEANLVAQVIKGDEVAFRSVFRAHTGVMYGVALRILSRNAADAEDAVQEAWLRAVRGLTAFRGESSLRTWLVGIAVRCALEQGRRRERDDRTQTDAVIDLRPSIAEGVDLERAIAALADGYRHVLVLHDVYGYTHVEIGALLGIDEGTSKSQLSRARHAVRRMLGTTPVVEDSSK